MMQKTPQTANAIALHFLILTLLIFSLFGGGQRLAAQPGTLDTTFSTDGIQTTAIGGDNDIANSVAIQSDGKILIAGYYYNGTNDDFAITRYNSDGSLDTTFSGDGMQTTTIGGGLDRGHSIAIQSDGKIVVAGYSNNGADIDFAVVRYNNDGSLDTTFSADGIQTTEIGSGQDMGYSVALQTNGKIVVAGKSHNGADSDFALVRYNSDGELDTTFSADGMLTTAIGSDDEECYSVAFQSDGKIVAVGYSGIGSNSDFAVVRYNNDGSLDTTFSADGIQTTDIGSGQDMGYSVAMQSDGKIVVAGYSYNGTDYDFAVVRYNSDGSLDTTFGANGVQTTAIGSDVEGRSVAIQSDGKIVVAGLYYNGANQDIAVVRYIGDCPPTYTDTTAKILYDERDCRQYPIEKIGNQWWMTENLDYLPSVVGPATGSNTIPYYYVYNYTGADVAAAKATTEYTTYGVLYNWTAAMNGAPSSDSIPSGVQGVCPDGWHVPSHYEWTLLEKNVGSNPGAFPYDVTTSGVWLGADEGGNLKETGTSHWNSPNTGATNSSGFTALPGGDRNTGGAFLNVGDYGVWWSATESGTGAWYRYLGYTEARVNRDTNNMANGFSCRCVKDFLLTLTVSITNVTNVSCNGGSNGTATASATGGTTPYNYLWNTGDTSASVNGLAAGNYSVTVTDDSSNTAIDSVIITEPAAIVPSVTTSNVSCNGASDGAATVNAAGGNPPYSYLWSTGDTLDSLSGLDSGTYTVNVTDSLSCTGIGSGTISEPPLIQSTATATICGNDSILLQGAYQTTAGTYFDTLTATNGCDSVHSTTLTINPNPTVSLTYTPDNGPCDGTATASASGGTSPYNYLWNDPSSQTTTIATGLCAGFYDVLVTDSNGCLAGDTVTVASADCNLNAAVSSTDASCGSNDGSATVTSTGGTTPYTYQWTNGDTLANADSMSAGVYMVDVWDNNGCNVIGVATISNTSGPSITVDNITGVNCNGGNDGAISISVTGGAQPYAYAWSSGQTVEDLTGLEAGPYDLQVTDANGCVAAVNLNVNGPAALNVTTLATNASCGNSDGIIAANVLGGTSPYTYLWSNAATSSGLTGLIWGAYSVTVTDANGCQDSASAGLSETGAATVAIDSIVPAPCSGDGGAYLSIAGGTAPFTYAWSNGDTTEDATSLAAGTYSVTVTDSSGCMAVTSVEVTAEALEVQQICMVTVDTIDLVNTVVWEKPASTSIDFYNIYKESTTAGVYFLAGSVEYDSLSAFTDPNSNPNQRSWRYKITAVDFCGNESDYSTVHKTMHVAINQGLGNNYNLSWNHYNGFSYGTYYIHRYRPSEGWVVKDSLPSNLNSWTDFNVPQGQVYYVVEAKHPDGCTATKTKNFNSSKSNTSTAFATGSLTASTSSANATLGNCDGSATVAVSGGTAPYTYLWDDSLAQITASATGLCPGLYNVMVVDADGNTVNDTVTVGEDSGAPPVSDFTANLTVITEGDSVNFTDLSVNSPTSWFWSFSGGTPSISFDQSPSDIKYLSPGSFDVALIATNSLGSDTLFKQEYILVNPDVGIGDFAVGPRNVRISPNPFTESTLLEFDNNTKESLILTVYDARGKVARIYEGITGNSIAVKRGELSPGTYYFILGGERVLSSGQAGRDAGRFVVE